MAASVASAPDRYEIPIQSRSVSRVFVQSGFDLKISEQEAEVAIRIENPIAVVTENPRPLARAEDELIPALGIYGRIVVSGSALRADSRTLDIVFHPTVGFWVEPHYEAGAWGPYGSKGVIVVCMPGSEMAVWFGQKGLRSEPTM